MKHELRPEGRTHGDTSPAVALARCLGSRKSYLAMPAVQGLQPCHTYSSLWSIIEYLVLKFQSKMPRRASFTAA